MKRINLPDPQNKQDCEKTGCLHGGFFEVQGKWDEEGGVCYLVEGETGGWTAPVKGAYFSYSAGDMGDITGDESVRGEIIASVLGCMVGDGPYPNFSGGCIPIHEYSEDGFGSVKEGITAAREYIGDLIQSIRKGKPMLDLKFCNPYTGQEVDPNHKLAVVTDDCSTAKRLYKELIEDGNGQ